ncbi:MAG: electron transport complex subunit RsxC [Clostridia bacterium]|nr:electron transport complex subunit RsxC [Clostridia bacterium]
MKVSKLSFNWLRRAVGKPSVFTFDGGIHPEGMKERTSGKAIIDIAAPKMLVFPLSQHIGASAKPCVEVGDRVLAGQKIAEADGFVSANIHSSVSGTVVAIEPRLHPLGTSVMSVVVENDGLNECSHDMKKHSMDEVNSKDIADIVREAGIVGMGGAAFPTHIKLTTSEDSPIKYVIVNGAECEPYLTSDHREMVEDPQEIIDGLKLTMKVFGLNEGYIAIETNKPDAIKVMTDFAKRETEVKINVVAVKTKYPQGSEKHLIKAVTGQIVSQGKLPKDVGAVVNNIDSCAAIARAVLKGIPLTKRIVTVSGDCVAEPQNLRVPIGTSFEHLVEICGGLTKTAAKVIMGGPMMGVAMSSLAVPVIKGSSGLLVFSEEMIPSVEEGSCLKCGKCVSGCPMNLLPNALKEAVLQGDTERLEKLNILSCIQCGSCTYVCPAEQNPLRYIRTGKMKLREAKK